MLSVRFENTKPITFIIVLLALLIGDGLFQFKILQLPLSDVSHLTVLMSTFVLLFLSLLLLHQIDRWNELTDTKNCYSIAFFSIFVVLFPTLFDKVKLVGANLLIIVALWRVLTLKTGEGIPQKLFDTSLLIICAGLLHPWALIFLLNVWISLLFYGAEKRRYWFIPLLAIITVSILLGAILLILQEPFPIDDFTNLITSDINNLLNFSSHSIATTIAVCSLALLLLVALAVYYFRSVYHSISSLVVIQFLWIGLIVVFLSKEVIYTFAPIAILFALYVEKIRVWWLKEIVLWSLLSMPGIGLLLHFITKS
ncbi:hypothetical protein HMPREF1321_1610 [Capnocytophaga sp. oral taxon 412 str. F0487]|jgi:hypothetical protein|uniref:hypothetical protein n=1 Tax=Capnocytophaga TaxID=1016 RepID=UPI0002697322|nr:MULTISPECIES: hypothetical protein [Capnocytophaga]AVM54396.1 hypothetical protein C3V44_01365 [Capnocytophaga sp. oral taxon 864]EIW92350.1 hypothetical protein HMPREF1321_1610 [Capnocytophaga sp. oral taxon 412 str. F0487]EJF37397.1 hypothetical protein HMPREF1320_1616 [Capnocytophaga sp. oral taxon 335 str. F0486]EKY08860.1 hypothetical protein HMPREF9078_00632 [Capnocytophaga sp. oral taxon 380 str. F0488]UZD37639.1 hypothetical protein OL230_07165 [Capnocytophaga ochracea]